MKSRAFVLAVLTLFFMGCTGKTELEENLTVENVTPSGSVGGVVYDAVTEAPIAGGVDVTVIAGGEEPAITTTDSNGVFMVAEIPASGDVIVLLHAGGYMPAVLTRSFVNAAGNFPLGNAVLSIGPIGLVPADQSMTVRLISESGAPVPDVSISASTYVRYMDMTDGWALPVGTSTLDATSDSSGRAVFSGLPDYIGLGNNVDDTLMVKVPPIDYNGDGIFDYRGGSFFLSFGDTYDPERVIQLRNNYSTQLRIDYSNVDALEDSGSGPSIIPYNGPIHVLFNLPVDSETLHIELIDEFDTQKIGTQTSVDGKYLSITFEEALDPGAKYHLRIHAVAAVGDQLVQRDFYAPLYTAPNQPIEVASVARRVISSDVPPITEFEVRFNQPIGTGNHSVNQNFHSANCVLWFDVNIGENPNVGNDPGEWGYDSCNIGAAHAFRSQEQVVSMPGAYQSGYSSRWVFVAPNTPSGPLPQGTRFYIIFSGITNQSYVVTTPGGKVVGDIMAQPLP